VEIQASGFTRVLIDNDAAEYGRAIYSALRLLDKKAPVAIVVEGVDDVGEGEAIMDRLRRAAGA
jgi:hypothetical protein